MRPFATLAAALGAALSLSVAAPGCAATRAEYAAACAAEMGAVPPFNCMQGDIIPIKVNGASTTTPVNSCDAPVQLGGPDTPCMPLARLLRLNSGVSTVETVAICRKYHASSGSTDAQRQADSNFHDIAVIQHNKATGNTCFFQSHVDPSPALNGSSVPAPGDPSAQGDTYWLPPASVGSIQCIGCHSADPFIWSPYVAQVADLSKWDPNGNWNSNFQNVFGKVTKTFKPTGNACVSCHRIGWHPSSQCSFVHRYTVDAKASSTHPSEFWMPPGGAWSNTFQTALDQIDRCCGDPSRSECNTQVADSPDGPPLGPPWPMAARLAASLLPIR